DVCERTPPQGDMTQSEATQRLSALTPLAEVLARVEALAQPVAPREAAVADAEGRVLAADVSVTAPRPVMPIALIDGWAVRARAGARAACARCLDRGCRD